MDEADREFIDEQASKIITDAFERVFGGKLQFDSKDNRIFVACA